MHATKPTMTTNSIAGKKMASSSFSFVPGMSMISGVKDFSSVVSILITEPGRNLMTFRS